MANYERLYVGDIEQRAKLHEVTHRSIREHLIPAKDWIRWVQHIESYGPLGVNVTNTEAYEDAEVWVMPYPYQTPLYMELLKARHRFMETYDISEIYRLSDDEISWWSNTLLRRINSLLQNGVSENLLAEWDDDSDVFVVLHNTTGQLVPFRYSAVSEFSISSSPVSLETYLGAMFKDSFKKTNGMSDEDYQRFMELTSASGNKYDLFYIPMYNNKDGDGFHNPGFSDSLTPRIYLDSTDAQALSEYMNNMMSIRAKVLRVP